MLGPASWIFIPEKNTRLKHLETDINFFNENCLEGMGKELAQESVDLVVTSPPYNLDIDYNLYDDSESRQSYLQWIKDWGKEIYNILDEDGSIFLNLGSKPSDPWGPHEVIFELRELFELQNEIHWVKSIAIQQKSYEKEVKTNVGHYKPINSDRYLNQCHEYIFHLTKNGDVELDRLAIGVPYKDKSNVGRWDSADADLRCRGNVWFIPYETIQDRDNQRPHPASFPVQLAEMAMKLHGRDKIDLALDPFLGIGNSAIAAEKLGVDFVGFEIDEEYLDIARSRLGEYQRNLF